MPIIWANSSDKQEAAAIREHTKAWHDYILYNNSCKALNRIIIGCINSEYIADLKDKNMGFQDYFVMQLLTYLGNEYTMIEPHKFEENQNRLSEPLNMDRPLSVFIKSLQNI